MKVEGRDIFGEELKERELVCGLCQLLHGSFIVGDKLSYVS